MNTKDILPTKEAREAANEILLRMADKEFATNLYASGPTGDCARLEWEGLHSLAYGRKPANDGNTAWPGTVAAAASALAEIQQLKKKRLSDRAYSARFDDVKSVERKRWNELHSVAFATGDAAKH